jgi:hypothetical protein
MVDQNHQRHLNGKRSINEIETARKGRSIGPLLPARQESGTGRKEVTNGYA